jgi:hypothetical protein
MHSTEATEIGVLSIPDTPIRVGDSIYANKYLTL